MLAKIYSACIQGLISHPVEVQVDVSPGFPSFTIVGLPDTAIQESRERIRAAIRHCGVPFPDTRVTVNLAPADVRKEGPSYDLPIAVGILMAAGRLTIPHPERTMMVGEVSLDGQVRPVTGVLSMAMMAQQQGFINVIVPPGNVVEAALVPAITVLSVSTIISLLQHYSGQHLLSVQVHRPPEPEPISTKEDFTHIKGHQFIKRALEIVAAGGHHIILYGPPGTGKTILAKSILSILPDMTAEEMLSVTQLYSIAGLLSHHQTYVRSRPFRQPHHSASMAAVVGGGRLPRPGEISLAHHGVLYLDELPEFQRAVLEALRQPLEEHTVTVARVEQSITYPAQTIFIGSLNPCPCGYYGDKEKECTCTPLQLAKYHKKLSGPLLDRVDLFCYVPRINFDTLTSQTVTESSAAIRVRVQQALNRQRQRYAGSAMANNATLPNRLINQHCPIDASSKRLLRQAMQTMQLSPRGFHRILRVARTIADLEDSTNITPHHLSEALQYRQFFTMQA
ncbi:MAG: YifB family Mg chelatase-like AAA ATPase [Candidatus Kerfeldbacteria bacterium]|nr:YifB family Mg chelatase-like AAA ATPase [Candidatus Kerfeldbacteria bacterium]